MKKTTYILISLALVLSLTVAVINSQGGGLGYQPCQTNQDCRSGYCRGGRCGTATCRNDKACLKAGLYDHYCRRRGPKIFRSECVPKRGKGQKCRRDRQCMSNKCLMFPIHRCT